MVASRIPLLCDPDWVIDGNTILEVVARLGLFASTYASSLSGGGGDGDVITGSRVGIDFFASGIAGGGDGNKGRSATSMTDGTTIPTSTTTIRSKDGEDNGGDKGVGAEDGTAMTTTTRSTGATAAGQDTTTRGRKMMQQPTK